MNNFKCWFFKFLHFNFPLKTTVFLPYYNIEFHCTYFMTNIGLDKLADTFKLPVKKLVGNLDYDIIRVPTTKLTTKELAYCENDCLVLYEYIKKEISKTNPKYTFTIKKRLVGRFFYWLFFVHSSRVCSRRSATMSRAWSRMSSGRSMLRSWMLRIQPATSCSRRV